MKSAKMKPLSPIMERHTPQHPLPEGIKNLASGETVCQFCGVSYLIHHEIKKLEEMVAHLEEELEHHQGGEERERKLKEELEKTRRAMNDLQSVITEKDSVIETITAEFESQRNENNSMSSKLSSEVKKYRKILDDKLSQKAKYKSSLVTFQSAIKLLKLDITKLKEESNVFTERSNNFKLEVQTKLTTLLTSCSEDIKSLRRKNGCFSEDLRVVTSDFEMAKKRAEIAEERLQTARNELNDLKGDQANFTSVLNDKVKDLEETLAAKNKELKLLEMKEANSRSQQVELEAKLQKNQVDLQSVVAKMQLSEESAAATIQRLNQDCRQLERELAASQEEGRKWKKAEKEREKRENDRNRETSLAHGKLDQLTNDLTDARETVKTLISEREMMTTAHQHQIQQLRESFRSKLEASESNPSRSQRELDALHESHRLELMEFEKTLRDEFRIEMSVERDKHDEAMSNLKSKLKAEMHNLDYNLRKDAEAYKDEISTLRQKVDFFTSNAESKKLEFEEERRSLKQIISQLEERITELTQEQEDRDERSRLASSSANQNRREMEDRNNELQREMITLKEEITLLQETVQRECEERFELTEALSQARDDLKHATGMRGSQTSFSAPVSALNRLHPGQVESNGPQLSGVTLKRLEAEGISPRSPGNNLPSLRSMPDLLPRREATNNAGKSSPAHPPTPPNASVTTHVRDLSFQSANGSPKRSHSGGSRENYQQRKSYSEPNGIHHSKSADTVDTVRRRIAAAIKRK